VKRKANDEQKKKSGKKNAGETKAKEPCKVNGEKTDGQTQNGLKGGTSTNLNTGTSQKETMQGILGKNRLHGPSRENHGEREENKKWA